MKKRLFIPGPVDVAPDVLARMATPMIGHRTKDASVLQKSCHDKMQKVFYTENRVMFSTSSGSGFMEGALRSCTRRRAAVFSTGAFGNRWFKMAEPNNVPADKFEVEWGTPTTAEQVDEVLSTGKYDLFTVTHNETSTGVMSPVEEIAEVAKKYPDVVWCVDAVSSLGGSKIEVDKLGIDVCITSTQKAMGLPPGLAMCSFSEKAYNATKEVEHRGLYFDMQEIYDTIEKKNHQYPSTPSISHMYALDYQLDQILQEGLDNRFERHAEMARFVRAWANEYFELLPEEKYASNTLTNIRNTREISVSELNRELGKRGMMISNGYGKMKDVSFRIAHMAETTLPEIKDLLANIEDILGL